MNGSQTSTFEIDNLKVNVYPNRKEMGNAAAAAVARTIRRLLEQQQSVSIVFAAAPSQEEFLAGLSAAEGINWRRVIAFHMDEYLGLPADAPQRFGNFLKDRIFNKVD
ncbi:MAG TPA: glucosamine-6-phosphate deaminase, partial [Bacteroidota bacterium]